MKKIFNVFLFLAALMFVYSCTSNEGKLKVDHETYTLDNGLKVVLHQDHSNPLVSVAIQFHVGSGREKVGKTGFAHFFEHMLFQRSENLPRNAFFQKISAMGGDFNGGTWQDGTIYYETVPRDALEKVLWMESDRMGFFINTVTQAGVDREIDVILNEKRQTTDNTAYGQRGAIFAKEMYPQGHPYSWTVIGEMDDIRSATIDDVKEFYSTYYIPQNATIAIAGDFDNTEVKALIEKYFGEIKPGVDVVKPEVRPAVLTQTKRVYYEDMFAPLPMLSISYPSVDMLHKDEAALSMLGTLLAGSKDTPMYKTIVEANLAPNVGVYNSAQEVAGTFNINVRAYSGVSLNDVYAAIEKGFQMFEQEGVDLQQMEMAKAMQERSTYLGLSSVASKSQMLAQYNEFAGKPDAFIDELEAFKSVTAEDVIRVYNQYVKGQNYLAISMVPKGQKDLALTDSREAQVSVENVEDASSAMTKSKAGAIVDDEYPRTPSKIDRSVEPGYMANTPSLTLPQAWKSELANGMKIVGITHNEIPLVSFTITLKGGLLLDEADKPGVAYLNAALMNEGTTLRTAEEIEKALNLLGANARVFSNRNSMGISGACLSKNFEKVMGIVEEIINSPKFEQEDLDREKNKVLARLQQDAKNPRNIASATIKDLMFGKESVNAKNPYGTAESINAITLDDIKKFYAEKFSPRLAQMSVTGAIDAATCEKALASLANSWTGEEVAIPEDTQEIANNKGQLFFVDYPGAKQSVIVVGGKGLPYSNPDYAALDVLNFKLGSGSNGELFNVLRLQRGYTYGAYSSFSPEKNYGVFNASSSVQSTVTKESVALFTDIISTFGERMNEEMLSQTKDAMIRSMASSFETQNALLNMLDYIYLYDLPADYVTREEAVIKGVTLEQLKKYAEEFLNTNDMTYVVVGDAKTQFKNLKGAKLLK